MNKFPLGQIVATPAALEALADSGQTPDFFLAKHAVGDWGEVCDGDKKLNDEALVNGGRLLSAYRTLRNGRIWVITEAADDGGNRLATTILLPSEY
jgi:hypothetical protein